MISALLALAAAAPLPPPPQAPVHYTVRTGDTLIGLATRWFVRADSWPQVQKLNRIADPLKLRPGKPIDIPRDLLKFEPMTAKIVAFRGPVMLSGKPPTLGAPVREGTAIATGADASVTVECADGSRFSLPSQTRIGIARLRRVLLTGDLDRVFTTVQGRAEWSVSKAPTLGSRFMVTTPVSVSAVRGTGFRVGYGEDAAIGVVDGVVGVSGSDLAQATPIPKNKGVAVSTAGVGKPVDLLPAPELLRAGAVQTREKLIFNATPVAGAKSYVFEIGTDAGLVDRIGEARGTGETATLASVPDGNYFVRVTATDPSGIDGLSRTVAFDRFMIDGHPPEAGERGMKFRWSSGDGPRDFRFTLFADEGETRPLIDRPGLAWTSFTVTDLRPGTYWWRVSATRFDKGRAITAIGELQSFTIAAPTR